MPKKSFAWSLKNLKSPAGIKAWAMVRNFFLKMAKLGILLKWERVINPAILVSFFYVHKHPQNIKQENIFLQKEIYDLKFCNLFDW